ncbi:hypothetical protein E1264_01090 [Actinomadura sp. KC216]|uniref:hypothetical protein n=1 Tax=Actinomadura sp. KC216 TaxID=2530370 RepID=UPI001042A987|nr:hypothetical protein [Actinomadura sp. KC216]TDB91578.1 hypothetical protein E1264_01090 [Actinomadura sp. KC216]
MEKKTVITVSAAALLAVMGAVGWKLGSADDPAKPSDGVYVHSTQDPGEVSEYWTPERQRQATGG